MWNSIVHVHWNIFFYLYVISNDFIHLSFQNNSYSRWITWFDSFLGTFVGLDAHCFYLREKEPKAKTETLKFN